MSDKEQRFVLTLRPSPRLQFSTFSTNPLPDPIGIEYKMRVVSEHDAPLYQDGVVIEIVP